EQEEEAFDIGIEEYFYSNSWCFIEWPEKVENLLPLETVSVYLTLNNKGTRNIQIK
ncbi:MAG: tRNA (adenosine(37)-N6)-threonylcarbamoyltransferase complex ATPase subunit type 1 TsaE, partial [Flavobacteriaceae bacterium]|nr:tRNA (adenosine(37)-N6)-threonylcarbamoyltransferase complex ATPase subunit type 1 TsaE [Flavobacteriaceae bacterium]